MPNFANSCQFLPLLKDTLGTIRQELSKIGKNWQKLATLRKSQRTLSFSHSAHLLMHLQIWTVKLSLLKNNCSFLGKYMDFKTNDGENTYVSKRTRQWWLRTYVLLKDWLYSVSMYVSFIEYYVCKINLMKYQGNSFQIF